MQVFIWNIGSNKGKKFLNDASLYLTVIESDSEQTTQFCVPHFGSLNIVGYLEKTFLRFL